jgi:hypothetical protein
MSKIQTLHFKADRSCLYATQSVVFCEIVLNSVVLMGVAERNKNRADHCDHGVVGMTSELRSGVEGSDSLRRCEALLVVRVSWSRHW